MLEDSLLLEMILFGILIALIWKALTVFYMAHQKDKKKDSIIGIIVLTIWLLGMLGPVGILILLPIGLMVAVYYYQKKKGNNDEGVAKTIDGIKQELKGAFEQIKDADAPQTLSDMLSPSERRHLTTGNTIAHDEFAHHVDELRDLRAAGIIDDGEYRDRVRDLKDELKV